MAMCCAVGGTVGVILMKLGMYMMCRNSNDSSVQAFALDHLNDVVVNSVGLVGVQLFSPRLELTVCLCLFRKPVLICIHYVGNKR